MAEPEFAIFMRLWGFAPTTGGGGQVQMYWKDWLNNPLCITYARLNPTVVVLNLEVTIPDGAREVFTGNDMFERCYNRLMEVLDNDNSY
jgi:hypothetical protein